MKTVLAKAVFSKFENLELQTSQTLPLSITYILFPNDSETICSIDFASFLLSQKIHIIFQDYFYPKFSPKNTMQYTKTSRGYKLATVVPGL
ncbi:hypothetical protein [Spirosoma terrae]|uniref:hypothetical protein n=1 Tax=Spirosoma terrae TaxID=1968276 RepID=UPI001FE4F8E7|nr:hypothetical protein [Spirosoma terrae]